VDQAFTNLTAALAIPSRTPIFQAQAVRTFEWNHSAARRAQPRRIRSTSPILKGAGRLAVNQKAEKVRSE
jgi:hypothetical protein